jgi:hypothetical protein
MIFGLSGLALEIAFGSCYAHLTGVVGSLIVVVVAGYYGNTTGGRFCPILPPLAPFLAPLVVAMVGAVLPPSTAAATLPTPNCLLTTSMLSCNIE